MVGKRRSELLRSYTYKERDFMLVLSRKKGETIVIGDDIRVTIVDVRADKVGIGVDAPTDISVHREEVYNAIQQEAAKPAP